MKAKLATSFVFVLALALSLTTTARPANPAAGRDDGKSDRDEANVIFGDHEGDACRNTENLEFNKNDALQVEGVIPIPTPAGKTLAFDITWPDPVTEKVYVSDRTNQTLDIFDAELNLFKAQVPGFVGTPAASPACPAAGSGPGCPNEGTTTGNDKGPNGVVTVPGYILVGDGNSTVQVIDNSPADGAKYLTIVQSLSTNLPSCDDGTHHYCERADEMGYDPKDHLVLINNDEPDGKGNVLNGSNTPYGNWIDVSSFPFKVAGTFLYPGAGGAEQPVWVPAIGEFIVTVPGNASPLQQSEIAYVKPLATSIDPNPLNLGALTNTTNMPCTGANGLALGANLHAVASACNGVVVFNVQSRKLINFDAVDVAPGDEVWANNGDGRFYVAGADRQIPLPAPQPTVLGVFDQQSGLWIQNVIAQGASDPAAFGETNTVFAHVGGAATTSTQPFANVCAVNGDNGTGCLVIFRHSGKEE